MIAIEPARLVVHSLGTLGQVTNDSFDGTWLLVEIAGERVDSGTPHEVRFENGRVSGQVGVNRFTGSYTDAGDTIDFGPAATTRMAGPPDLMDLEDRFLSALQGEHPMRIETRLVIGDLVFTLEPDRSTDDTPER
jgi:heat shock protein HslJ